MLHAPSFPEVTIPDQTQKYAPNSQLRSNMLSLLHERHNAVPVSLTAVERNSNSTIRVMFTLDRRSSESLIKLDLEAEEISISEPLISLRGPVGRALECLMNQTRFHLEPLLTQQHQICRMLKRLRKMYENFQLRSLTAWVSLAPRLAVFDVEIELDDAAVRINPERFTAIKEALAADGHNGQGVAEVEASKHGIVYARWALLLRSALRKSRLILRSADSQAQEQSAHWVRLSFEHLVLGSQPLADPISSHSQWRWSSHEYSGCADAPEWLRPDLCQLPRYRGQSDQRNCQAVISNHPTGRKSQVHFCEHLWRLDLVRHDCKRHLTCL